MESTLAEASPLRGSQDFRDIENKWADQELARAEVETDAVRKRGLYQRVSQHVGVDGARRKLAADKLQQMDTASGAAAEPTQLPLAAAAAPPSETPTPSRSARIAQTQEPSERPTPVAAYAPVASPPPAPAIRPGVDDKERQLALQGTQDSKVLLKQQLEPRVFGGRASDTEIRLLISTCKDLGDRLCVQQARAVMAQRKDQ
jgi:hypothetical protein